MKSQERNLPRPKTFGEFIGQKKLKENLKVVIESAKKRKTVIDHLLLHGPPGVGKTSLAHIIANECGVKIRFAQGPLLEKKADLLSLFASISKGEIIFIDEVHGMSKAVEEMLYSALEDGVIDIVVGAEGETKIVRMKLPDFSLIAATTKLGKIAKPLRDRFGIIGKLTQYTEEEIAKIIQNSSKLLKYNINKENALLIASFSSHTPRIANTLLKRCADYLVVQDKKELTGEIIKSTLNSIGVYSLGLRDQHLDYMKVVGEVFYEKWASLDALSGVLLETRENIESNIEPLLLKEGLIEKSSRGRRLTNKGVKYLTNYNL